jgi:CDP-paratose 2-epimerase
MKTAVVTGSAGLVGAQACEFFHEKGFKVVGIDNDMRAYYFGEAASTSPSSRILQETLDRYTHHCIDVRDYAALKAIFEQLGDSIEIVVHSAAQPSHDWAAKEPLTDFSVNATGTLHLLELTRQYCPQATFIFTSTNKVYGDRPNRSHETGHPDEECGGLEIRELQSRYEGFSVRDGSLFAINEKMSIDNCKHSVFGASKVAADVMCQEYGRYFGMNVGIFRCGCLTGPNHAGAPLHGFLSYLVKCIVHGRSYTVFGYKGKQVRDNLHSKDLVNMFWSFHRHPRRGEVYNVGGGRANAVSVLEAIEMINRIAGTGWDRYTVVDQHRIGDHIWYISDLSKFTEHYPGWKIEVPLEKTIEEMVARERR